MPNIVLAAALYKRFCERATGIPAIALPSTGPANARTSQGQLVEAYSVILENL